ncbi:MAG: hypothetical protein Q9170_002796 [Blastenia crenularia]
MSAITWGNSHPQGYPMDPFGISPSNIIAPETSARLTRQGSAAISSCTKTDLQRRQSIATAQPDVPNSCSPSVEVSLDNIVGSPYASRLTRRGSAASVAATRTFSTRQEARYDPATRVGRPAWKKHGPKATRDRVQRTILPAVTEAVELAEESTPPEENNTLVEPAIDNKEVYVDIGSSEEESRGHSYPGFAELGSDPCKSDSDSSSFDSRDMDKENQQPCSPSIQDTVEWAQQDERTGSREIINIATTALSDESLTELVEASESEISRPLPHRCPQPQTKVGPAPITIYSDIDTSTPLAPSSPIVPNTGTLPDTRQRLYEDPLPAQTPPARPSRSALAELPPSTSPRGLRQRLTFNQTDPLTGSEITFPLPETAQHPSLTLQPPSDGESASDANDVPGKPEEWRFQPIGEQNLLVRTYEQYRANWFRESRADEDGKVRNSSSAYD